MPSSRKTRTKTPLRRWRESRAAKRARGQEIISRLREMYPDAAAELNYGSAFQFLISVILSAQTTDVTVNRVTPNLFRQFPTAKALAESSQAEVEDLVRQTGFFRSKAKSIRIASAQIVDEFNGEVPRTMDELLRLRGVARKTANVVLGEAFGLASGVVVDTHVKRLAQRLGLSEATDPVKIERDLMNVLDTEDWIFAGIAIIWHGRRVCDARKPDCDACELNNICPSSTSPTRPTRSPFTAKLSA